MPKRSRTAGSAADQATGEPNEERRKRLRMALAAEQAVEQATGEQMDEETRRKFRLKLLQYYEQESAEKNNKEQNQHGVSLESATVSNVVEQPAGETLTREEISKTLKGLVVMLKTQNEQDQCETSPEPDRVSGDVDVVDMADQTTGGSDCDMDRDEDDDEGDDEDDDEDDDDIYHDSDDSEDSDGYSDGRGWYCLGHNDMYEDEDESENEEANTRENEYIPSPWSVGDTSTPKDPFAEDSPQVDLMGTFHNERGNHNRAEQAVDPLLRDPVILSLKSEAEFENYHKRPRIDFGHRWRP